MALSLDCLGNPKDHQRCPYTKELEGRGEDDEKAEQREVQPGGLNP